MDNAQMHAGLRRRDPAALSAMMATYTPTIYALCAQILRGAGSDQDIEECTSDAFLAAWHRIDQYHPAKAPLRTWLLMLAKYQALNRRRQLTRHAAPALLGEEMADHPPPDDALTNAEERKHVHAALHSLPELERKMIYRRYYLGEAVSAIAERFGLTRQAADNRLWRARQAMRTALGDSWEEVSAHGRGAES